MPRVNFALLGCAAAALTMLAAAPTGAKILTAPHADGLVELAATTPLPRARPAAAPLPPTRPDLQAEAAERAEGNQDAAEADAEDTGAAEGETDPNERDTAEAELEDNGADATAEESVVEGGADADEAQETVAEEGTESAATDGQTETAEDETAGTETAETGDESSAVESDTAEAGSEDEATQADAAKAPPLPRGKPVALLELANKGWPLTPVVSDGLAAETKAALDHLFARRFDEALRAQRDLDDALAAKLVEFFFVRDPSVRAPHHRILDFMQHNPDWPSQGLIRRRYEVALLSQRADAETVLAAFKDKPPTSSPGTIAFAGALQASGETERATAVIRELWRTTELTEGEEKLVRQRFGDSLTKDDHRFRMARLLYGGKRAAGLRTAKLLGGNDLKLAEARIAVMRGASNAKAALDAVPKAARSDPLYILSRIQHTRRSGKEIEAAGMLLEAPSDPEELIDPDAWAVERRIAARTLLEEGDAATAYDVMRGHSAQSDVERIESDWLAGWIALSFLDDPVAARRHFAQLRPVTTRPISMARAEYWLGRSAEATGEFDVAAGHYRRAAEHPTTYYGQLALDRITREGIAPPRKPIHAAAARRVVQEREPVRAIRLLAQTGHRESAAALLMSMVQESEDPLTVVGVSELAHGLAIPSTVVQIGKIGVYSGHPTEAYSFTTMGIPYFPTIGQEIEPALVYAVARQESLFDHTAGSHAGALGLMQLMPGTAQQMAQSHGLTYSKTRLTSDAIYNATLGAAYLGRLIERYGDAYALVFAAYNAGPGRVNEWIGRYGDPRKGEVDPVDWVEMIPFTETRNYVQRVMEGLQVYRAALGGETPLMIAQDLRIPEAERAVVVAEDEQGPFETLLGSAPAPSPPTSGLGFAAPPPPAAATGFGFSGH